jgi:hypothetical protein
LVPVVGIKKVSRGSGPMRFRLFYTSHAKYLVNTLQVRIQPPKHKRHPFLRVCAQRQIIRFRAVPCPSVVVFIRALAFVVEAINLGCLTW